jgi:protocatechuate 3,4-dioxygenase beta subunit
MTRSRRLRAPGPAAALLLTCGLSAFAFQEPKGAIEGRVVNAASGDPLRRVNLTLTPAKGKARPATSQTDENGRFAFRDVEPGAYRLSGERTGFPWRQYGSRLNPSAGVELRVVAGQTITNLTFRLTPAAIISGRVLDQEGEPLPNLMVTASRNGYSNGRRQWLPAGSAQTNDRGEFRISNLRAGRYIVTATDMNIGIGIVGISKDPLPERPESAYASTHYGNTTDLSRAASVDLATGDERRGLQIQMLRTSTVRVRGRAIGAPEGKPIILMLLQRQANTVTAVGSIAQMQSDGAFELRSVPPGSYLLLARSQLDIGSTAGAMPIEVSDRHIDGLEFRLSGGGELAGQVTVSGPNPAGSAEPVNVTLERVDFTSPDAPSATAAPDGKFTLKNLFAGRYRVRVSGIGEDAYIQSVKLSGHEVDQSDVDLTGATSGPLEIRASRAGAQVEGTVAGPDDKPVAGAMVTLIPESKRESHYASATSGPDGTFHLKGIAPGKYRLVAWEDVEPGAWRDPEFVKPFESRAETLALEENGRSKLTIKAISSEMANGGTARQ